MYSYNIWYKFSGDSDGKQSDCNARDMGSIPELGRCAGERNDTLPTLPITGIMILGLSHDIAQSNHSEVV